ncbi:MAG: TadE/TadG family type IV pilus assembly protein [Desulfobaccales bacterium]
MKFNGRRNQEGAGVVEFALIAPLFVMFLFGLVEFGLAMYNKAVLTNASREAARFGVVYSTPRKTQAEIVGKVQEYLTKAGFTETATITVTGAQGTSGSPLSVTVSCPYEFQVLPNFVAGMMGTVNLTANTVMLME